MNERIDKKYLLSKIASNEISLVIEMLNNLLDSIDLNTDDFRNKLALIESKFNEYKFQSTSNLIAKETEFLFRNRISWDLLNYIKELPESIITGKISGEDVKLYAEPKFLLRITSSLIDFAVYMIILLLVSWYIEVSEEAPEEIIAFTLFLFFIKDIFYGRSLGKRITGLSVKNISSINKTKEVYFVIRNITLIIWPIDILLLMLMPSRKLGDMIANTIVVKESEAQPFWSSLRNDIKKFNFTRSVFWALVIALLISILPFIIFVFVRQGG